MSTVLTVIFIVTTVAAVAGIVLLWRSTPPELFTARDEAEGDGGRDTPTDVPPP